jgi:hypothetical protein
MTTSVMIASIMENKTSLPAAVTLTALLVTAWNVALSANPRALEQSPGQATGNAIRAAVFV